MSSKGKQQVVSSLGRELAVALEGSIAAAKDAAELEAEAARDEAQVARDEAAVFADAVNVRARLLRRDVLRLSLAALAALAAALGREESMNRFNGELEELSKDLAGKEDCHE